MTEGESERPRPSAAASAALLVLLFVSCATQRVMTYNIRLDIASDGPNAWPHRKEFVARIMQGADLAGVQEALPDQLRDLDERLHGFGRFGVGRTAERSGEHTAVFFRKDRYDVLEHDTFWLSETPTVAGSRGWDAAYERIVTWGKLRDRRSGATFFLFNTHFDHVGRQARRESARLLASRIGAIAGGAPVIVIGDFNDVAGSDAYGILTGIGLRDSRSIARAAPRGPDSTWNAFRAIEPGRRIDFIFVRGPIEVVRHETIPETLPDGRFPSDHLPVIATVRVGSD